MSFWACICCFVYSLHARYANAASHAGWAELLRGFHRRASGVAIVVVLIPPQTCNQCSRGQSVCALQEVTRVAAWIRFTTIPESALELLSRMLAFNPEQRINTNEALACEYLAASRKAVRIPRRPPPPTPRTPGFETRCLSTVVAWWWWPTHAHACTRLTAGWRRYGAALR